MQPTHCIYFHTLQQRFVNVHPKMCKSQTELQDDNGDLVYLNIDNNFFSLLINIILLLGDLEYLVNK